MAVAFSIVAGIAVFLPIALIGWYAGRRSREIAKLTFIVKALPASTQKTVIELLVDELEKELAAKQNAAP